MKYWQICPLNPTSFGNSPYQSPSAFAGNPYFIDLREFVALELIGEGNLSALKNLPHSSVHFGDLYEHFWPILRLAFENFQLSDARSPEFEIFCKKSAWWLDDYALFMAAKDKFGGRQCTQWPEKFSTPEHAEMHLSADSKFKKSLEFHKFTQWMFERQFRKLKAFANENGIFIVGDIPIFVGEDSADVWANRKIFKLRRDGTPSVVAGVPPDAFSKTGQLWGNPIYDWEALAAGDFSWWASRIKRCLELYDVVRLDHFRGFCDYWEIPAPAADATRGKWTKSIGIKFFEHLGKIFPNAKFIAEDLGVLSANAINLLEKTGLPGMDVLHFAFDGNSCNKYLPHCHERNSVLYLGTHDNDTTRGWFHALPEEIKHQVRCYVRTDGNDIAWDLIKTAYASPSNLLILSMQDIFNLGTEARFNKPSTVSGNWEWRATADQFDRLREMGTPEYLCHLRSTYGR
jgi:4-alpha-glucanotransferase